MRALVIAALLIASPASAATYYIATNGNNANAGTSGAPWATFAYAFAHMSGGDTLIVKDGTYNQSIRYPPSGTAGAYTTIRAENQNGATIDSTGLGAFQYAVRIDPGTRYIVFDGFNFRGNPSSNADTSPEGPSTIQGDHIKILRCGLSGAPQSGNGATLIIGPGADYVLVEDSWVWGTGRYHALTYQSDHTVFRRVVSRHDYSDITNGAFGNQCANFTNYDSNNTLFQNVIAIDSGSPTYSVTGHLYGAFWFENNNKITTNITVQGSLALNIVADGMWNDPKVQGAHTIEHSAGWTVKGGYGGGASNVGTATTDLNHVTLGNLYGTHSDAERTNGIGARSDGTFSAYGGTFASVGIRNSLITGAHDYALADVMTSDYNRFWSNAASTGATFYEGPSPSLGAHDATVNPGMMYVTRIENGSPLKGAALDGGDIGATILYRYGVSGTLWGETGYDQLTATPLWPFPNEAQIKSDMAAYSGPGLAGARGFAASGTGLYGGAITLTSYIWEYLGNAMPANIYGTVPLRTRCQ